MPYRTGEESMVGDMVRDSRRVGFVSHIVHYGVGPAELVIQRNDDTLGIRYLNFEKLVLSNVDPLNSVRDEVNPHHRIAGFVMEHKP